MISKTKIEKRTRKKTNPKLVKTIIKIKKKNPEIARILTHPTKKNIGINLKDIEKKSGDFKEILVPGKILSSGDLTKKIKIVAFSASKTAKAKIEKSGSKFISLLEEIQKNPELKNLELVR